VGYWSEAKENKLMSTQVLRNLEEGFLSRGPHQNLITPHPQYHPAFNGQNFAPINDQYVAKSAKPKSSLSKGLSKIAKKWEEMRAAKTAKKAPKLSVQRAQTVPVNPNGYTAIAHSQTMPAQGFGVTQYGTRPMYTTTQPMGFGQQGVAHHQVLSQAPTHPPFHGEFPPVYTVADEQRAVTYGFRTPAAANSSVLRPEHPVQSAVAAPTHPPIQTQDEEAFERAVRLSLQESRNPQVHAYNSEDADLEKAIRLSLEEHEASQAHQASSNLPSIDPTSSNPFRNGTSRAFNASLEPEKPSTATFIPSADDDLMPMLDYVKPDVSEGANLTNKAVQSQHSVGAAAQGHNDAPVEHLSATLGITPKALEQMPDHELQALAKTDPAKFRAELDKITDQYLEIRTLIRAGIPLEGVSFTPTGVNYCFDYGHKVFEAKGDPGARTLSDITTTGIKNINDPYKKDKNYKDYLDANDHILNGKGQKVRVIRDEYKILNGKRVHDYETVPIDKNDPNDYRVNLFDVARQELSDNFANLKSQNLLPSHLRKQDFKESYGDTSYDGNSDYQSLIGYTWQNP